MNIRDALIYQSPSLELQRAAADHIAHLESELRCLDVLSSNYAKRFYKQDQRIRDIEDYLEAHDLTQEFEEWLKRNTEP